MLLHNYTECALVTRPKCTAVPGGNQGHEQFRFVRAKKIIPVLFILGNVWAFLADSVAKS